MDFAITSNTGVCPVCSEKQEYSTMGQCISCSYTKQIGVVFGRCLVRCLGGTLVDLIKSVQVGTGLLTRCYDCFLPYLLQFTVVLILDGTDSCKVNRKLHVYTLKTYDLVLYSIVTELV